MDRFVLNVFKGIMISMIMIFLFDMLSYLYRAVSVDQRMLNIMTGMQRVVMENNYLPEESEEAFAEIFTNLARSYNGGTDTLTTNNVNGSVDENIFIQTIGLNYKITSINDLKGDFSSFSLANARLDTACNYGDIKIIQAYIDIRQPIWGFATTQNTTAGGEYSSNNFNRQGYSTNRMVYTYLVPCLHYQRI